MYLYIASLKPSRDAHRSALNGINSINVHCSIIDHSLFVNLSLQSHSETFIFLVFFETFFASFINLADLEANIDFNFAKDDEFFKRFTAINHDRHHSR